MSLPVGVGQSSEALLIKAALRLSCAIARTPEATAELRRHFELRCEAQIGQKRVHQCSPVHCQGTCPVSTGGTVSCICCLNLAKTILDAAATYSVFPDAVTTYLLSAYELDVVRDHLPEGFVLETCQPNRLGVWWQILHPERAQAEQETLRAAQAAKEEQARTLVALLIQMAFRDLQGDAPRTLVEAMVPLILDGLPPNVGELICELGAS
jgi:hypothetical protein